MKCKFKKIWGEWKNTIMAITAFIIVACLMLSLSWIKHDDKQNNPMESTSEEKIKAKSFDYKGHQYILFEECRAFGASSFIHDPDCKKCKLRQ